MESLVGAEIQRKEKRKLLKKLKRKQIRKEIALKERAEEEARSDDPEEQRKIMLKEQEEAEMMERQRKEFEERERLWMERMAKKREEEEEEEERRMRRLEEEELQRKQIEHENELNEGDGWEYEEGPAEIIWQGNEIIVKKKRVKVAKRNPDQQHSIEDANRPTSNPLPPQSEAYSSYKNTSVSAKQVFESVSNQNPNFGTEQDKAHCPFHIKTGACRFGPRCSRVHFYPDRSCTLLIKNMYNGPGLSLEQDEGLEHTDEEVERCYEEFYEDVHTEFLKFGEIVNFKVCRNGSFHLRGNVYVHYKSLESALLAYHSINGRYFAGKQITCEYVGVTRWKVAICGEYMKSGFKTCSHGMACNFIHCFRNPGGDYEWADWDKPPPRYWVKKMTALFGPSDEFYELGYEKRTSPESRRQERNSGKKLTEKSERHHSRRSRSRGMSTSDEDRGQRSSRSRRRTPLASSRTMRSSHDDHDYYSHDYSIRDRERDNSHSKEHSRHSSKWKDHPANHENGEKRYSGKDYEWDGGKDRLESDDSCGKYLDSNRVHSRNHSSRRGSKTRRAKEADHLDRHVKSDENTESDNPGCYDGRSNYHDSNSRPSSETMDPCDRWETRPSSPSELHSSDDTEALEVKSNDRNSGGHRDAKRPKCNSRSSSTVHSVNCEEQGDSSSESTQTEDNHEHYHEKRHHRKHRSRGHKKHKIRKNEKGYTSGKFSGKPDCEQEEQEDHSEKRWSSNYSRKDHNRCKKRKHRTKKETKDTDKEENLKLNRASRKRSRSRSPARSSSRSKGERRQTSHES